MNDTPIFFQTFEAAVDALDPNDVEGLDLLTDLLDRTRPATGSSTGPHLHFSPLQVDPR